MSADATNDELWHGHPLFDMAGAAILRTPAFWWNLYLIADLGSEDGHGPGKALYLDRVSPVSNTTSILMRFGTGNRQLQLQVQASEIGSVLTLKTDSGRTTWRLGLLDAAHPSPKALRWKEVLAAATYLEEHWDFPTSPRLTVLLLAPFLAVSLDDAPVEIQQEVERQLHGLGLLSEPAIKAALKLLEPSEYPGAAVSLARNPPPDEPLLLDTIARLLRVIGVHDIEPAGGWPDPVAVIEERLEAHNLAGIPVVTASSMTSTADMRTLVSSQSPNGTVLATSLHQFRSGMVSHALHLEGNAPLFYAPGRDEPPPFRGGLGMRHLIGVLQFASPAPAGGLLLRRIERYVAAADGGAQRQLLSIDVNLLIICVDGDDTHEVEWADSLFESLSHLLNEQTIQGFDVLIIEGILDDHSYVSTHG